MTLLDDRNDIEALHAAWCAYQIAVGQEYNEVPTEAQVKSLEDSVRRYRENPDRTPEESHHMWVHHKIMTGWTWGKVKDEVAKTHPDMVPFSELPEVEQRKDTMHIVSLRIILG